MCSVSILSRGRCRLGRLRASPPSLIIPWVMGGGCYRTVTRGRRCLPPPTPADALSLGRSGASDRSAPPNGAPGATPRTATGRSRGSARGGATPVGDRAPRPSTFKPHRSSRPETPRKNLTQFGHLFNPPFRASLRSDNCPNILGTLSDYFRNTCPNSSEYALGPGPAAFRPKRSSKTRVVEHV